MRIISSQTPTAHPSRMIHHRLVQVGPERQEAFQRRQTEMAAAEGLLDRVRLTANSWKHAGIPIGDSGGWHSAADLLARTELSLQQVGACSLAVMK
jgi:hypothetical protein